MEYIVDIPDNDLTDRKKLIRCKDCKHYPNNGMEHQENHPYWLPCKHFETDPDWYCGSGKSKDGEGE